VTAAAGVEVAVLGAGVLGCALAAQLAEAGRTVAIVEPEGVGAGASGRNSGALQHPIDAGLAPLYAETLARARELGAVGPEPPAGLLVLGLPAASLPAAARALAARCPELAPAVLDGEELRRAEPSLAPGLAALRLETAHPVRPRALVEAVAARARELGVRWAVGGAPRLVLDGDRAIGVAGAEAPLAADVVVVAAGHRTPAVIDSSGRWAPVRAVWGATAEVALAAPPRHVLEEEGVEELVAARDEPPGLFSLVTAGGASVLGSTFAAAAPDPDATAPRLVRGGARFVPALGGARVLAARACGRPVSFDGRPLLGPVAGRRGLWLATGHGPWGISLGLASARLVADAILGRGQVPPAFAAARAGAPPG
jgi:glycine/D-amino acid oxidase-like deaminating enzyme